MRPAIATVTSSRGWERRLTELARTTGLVRLVGRYSEPEQLHAVASTVDVVYLGSEVPWLTVEGVRALVRSTTVIGIVSGPSDPMSRVFRAAGVSELILDTAPAMVAISAALSALRRSAVAEGARTITVTGARGAPGRTEIALALAWSLGPPTLLAELDADGPSLGVRTAIPPPVHVPDPANTSSSPLPTFGPVTLFVPPLTRGPLSAAVVARVLDTARATHDRVVLDVGPCAPPYDGDALVVCDSSPVGIVRCAALLQSWLGPEPALVVNRVDDDLDLGLIRRATGLEPVALVPRCTPPAPGEPPAPEMLTALEEAAGLDTRGTAA